MRVVIAPGSFGDALGAAAAAGAVAAGWRRAAPHDDLVLLPIGDGGTPTCLDAALDGAGLVITGEACFDWRSLRDTALTVVAQAAAARGVPCVVLAGQVLVGRREAAAVGVDTAYAVADPAADPDPAAGIAALAEEVARRWSR